ncbi:endo-1,3(4)-beta-glucanase [Exophiala aquamarina CBS 119918]|uniref:endo-1,3(4)-beta-glucanase n=1 Tax=Exophiala aquamarina CBS 119918 TaxID=1182545 RepID=A0A072P5Q2_9EURO|nr:endo-1,3(4)-beta-glucanase [Exophiala aquamarina CBS 119918]KEF50945.1 endo-1,3(4)-beta-glucanase [Exophiala aquamarina CBS 119918]
MARPRVCSIWAAVRVVVAVWILWLTTVTGSVHARYVLIDHYAGDSFLDRFDFFTGPDPTHGYVTYLDRPAATRAGLVALRNESLYLGVDSNKLATGPGRASVRITSQTSYHQCLLLLDLTHMPGSTCGTWPAFWTVGPNWPDGGEIDIIEGVNTQNTNAMSLHTNRTCHIRPDTAFSGTLIRDECERDRGPDGCTVVSTVAGTYGDELNEISGGIYAMEWTEHGIRVWFFPRGSTPVDVLEGLPEPAQWPTPLASFTGDCQFNSSFTAQKIVFDTTFCGDWAGATWKEDSVCSPLAEDCETYVRDNPAAFTESYWSINHLKVYDLSSGAPLNDSSHGSVVGSSRVTGPSPSNMSVPQPSTGPDATGPRTWYWRGHFAWMMTDVAEAPGPSTR